MGLVSILKLAVAVLQFAPAFDFFPPYTFTVLLGVKVEKIKYYNKHNEDFRFLPLGNLNQ